MLCKKEAPYLRNQAAFSFDEPHVMIKIANNELIWTLFQVDEPVPDIKAELSGKLGGLRVVGGGSERE